MYNAKIVDLPDKKSAGQTIAQIGVCAESVRIMSDKAVFRAILLCGVRNAVANIIKQEMLSCGADAAVSRWTVDCSRPKTDVLLFGTIKHYRHVIAKMRMQCAGLPKGKKAEYKAVADELAHLLNADLKTE
jgi:dihydropteroate synthase